MLNLVALIILAAIACFGKYAGKQWFTFVSDVCLFALLLMLVLGRVR